MADTKPTFNIFGPVTEKEIRVGYISTDRGYVQFVDLCEANRYEKNNPGTTFIYAVSYTHLTLPTKRIV